MAWRRWPIRTATSSSFDRLPRAEIRNQSDEETDVDRPTDALATFDFAAFFGAVDDARRRRELRWYGLAEELWELSAQLNAERDDHPLCGGAVSRLGARGETSCQYALNLLRWLDQAPEAFLVGPVRDVGDVHLPDPGPDSRLRWDLGQLH